MFDKQGKPHQINFYRKASQTSPLHMAHAIWKMLDARPQKVKWWGLSYLIII